jgi:hypothetical protein
MEDLTLEDLRRTFNPRQIRALQIIQGSMALGIAILAGFVVAAYVYQRPMFAQAHGSDVFVILFFSVIHALWAVAGYLLAPRLMRIQLDAERLVKPGSQFLMIPQEPSAPLAERAASAIRAAILVRLAIYEGIAVWGLVVCLVAVLFKVIYAHPIYWLNAITAVVMIAYAIRTFPSRASIMDRFGRQLIQRLAA